ncbi:unnamed protein product [Ectocarpus sp. 4 AP-2014]
MSERPFLTKSVTSALVSALGELVGSALRSSSPPPLPVGAGTALAVKGRAGAGQGTGAAAPGLLRRTAAFAIFGLLVNGPVFHWWYGALERAAARRRKVGEPPGGASDITFKVAVDRFLMTPPYLAATLASLRLLQGLGAKRSIGETSALYRGVLFTNWKIWTAAQLINFKLVPIEYRPVFGECTLYCTGIRSRSAPIGAADARRLPEDDIVQGTHAVGQHQVCESRQHK